MKRAALYIRVSTEEQAKHGFSLAEQQHDLEQYARAHHYTVVGVYADEGNTARKALSRRKELQRLLDDVRADKVDIILLKCLDRWFRNVRDYYKVQDVLDQHGVEWECTQEDYNTTTTNGRLMLNLKLSIAQNESDQTSDRIKYVNEGKHRRKEETTGKHPFGYELKDKHLVVIEKERPIVEFIFQQILAGYATHSIFRKILDKFGIAIDARRVWRILRNPTYKGVRYGIPDYCPAIIPPEQFDRVQTILSRNQQPRRSGRIYLFSGKVVCPSCGTIMVAHRGYVNKKKNIYQQTYICGNRYITGKPHTAGGCLFGGGISENVIEKFLLNNIRPLLESYLIHFDQQNKHVPEKDKIKSIKIKLSRLKDLYLDGLIDKDSYKVDYERLQKELAQAAYAAANQKTISPLVDKIMDDDDFMNTYLTLPREHKRELWQSLIQRIELGRRPEERGKSYKDIRIFFY